VIAINRKVTMSIIRFIGDVHGKYRHYGRILDTSPYRTIQVGDMGVGFRRWPHGEYEANPPYDKMLAGEHRFIRGNHDNPDVCRRHSQYIMDGTMMTNGIMFVGGALSIDKAYRYEDYSWWADEELSPPELKHMSVQFEAFRPQIMVTHECPESIAAMIVGNIPDLRNGGSMKMDPRFASRTRQWFEIMFHDHKPKLWIFGHWHVPFDYIHEGTRFICLPELATVDVDTNTAEVIYPEPKEEWPSGKAASC
jgi:hypothetical protein